MNYAGIQLTDIANGTGVRVSLFVSGCRIHCPGCHNKEAWDFGYGKEFTYNKLDLILDRLSKPFISGLTILGGEPLDPHNVDTVMMILYICKRVHPEKTIWLYTGYTIEQVGWDNPVLKCIDVLVDGPYIEEQRDISLAFRGSQNQRMIDVQKSLSQKEVVLYEGYSG